MSNKRGPHHDHFARRCLSDIDLARELFYEILAEELEAAIDLKALCDAKETYVDQDLDVSVTDLLFTAPYRKRNSFISLLVEHKSEGALRLDQHILPFQMRLQEMKIMDHGFRNHPKHLYPYVHMIGLYHGRASYNGPMSVAEKMDVEHKWKPARWQEKMILVDIGTFEDEDLLQRGKLGIFLLVLKYIYDPNILEILEKLVPQMRKVEGQKNGADFLYTVFEYLYKASRIEKKEDLNEIAVQSLSRETGEHIMMTLAEKDRKEARKEAWKEASEVTRKETRKEVSEQFALRLIDDGLDVKTVVRYTKLSEEAVERLKKNHPGS